MRRIVPCVLALAWCVTAHAQDQIPFAKSWEEGFAEAKERNVPVLFVLDKDTKGKGTWPARLANKAVAASLWDLCVVIVGHRGGGHEPETRTNPKTREEESYCPLYPTIDCGIHMQIYIDQSGGFDYEELPAGFILRPNGTELLDVSNLSGKKLIGKISDAQTGLGEGIRRIELVTLEKKLAKGDKLAAKGKAIGARKVYEKLLKKKLKEYLRNIVLERLAKLDASISDAEKAKFRASGKPAKWFKDLPKELQPPLPLPAGVYFGESSAEYVNGKDGSLLVYVPPGTFSMGHEDDRNQIPVHQVTVSKGFFLGKYEVSWAQFQKFVADGGPGGDAKGAGDDHPVANVKVGEAEAYCEWAGLTLPTEAQWELAARGTDGRTYPWGSDAPTAKHANLQGTADGHAETSPVGTFPTGASPYGCLDMIGNVGELCSDGYAKYSADAQTDPTGQADAPYRVLRGGWYALTPKTLKGTGRIYSLPSRAAPTTGFRVCRTYP